MSEIKLSLRIFTAYKKSEGKGVKDTKEGNSVFTWHKAF